MDGGNHSHRWWCVHLWRLTHSSESHSHCQPLCTKVCVCVRACVQWNKHFMWNSRESFFSHPFSPSYVASAKDLKVRAGEWDTQTTKERLPYQERIVSRIFSHPTYNERSLANDIVSGIRVVCKTIIAIRIVCLKLFRFVGNCWTGGSLPNGPSYQHGLFAAFRLRAESTKLLRKWMGFVIVKIPVFAFRIDRFSGEFSSIFVVVAVHCFAGKDVFGQAGKYSVIMKKVPLGIVEFTRCQSELQASRLTEKFRLDASFICAGGVEGVDTCEVLPTYIQVDRPLRQIRISLFR